MTARLARRGSDRRRNRTGFTLLEMLAVILIIAILISIAFPAYNAVISRTRIATVRSEMGAINSAIADFKSRYNTEPPSNISFILTGGNLPPQTKAVLRKMFPGITFNAALNTELDKACLLGKELRGTEALVFFLGGVRRDPDNNASTRLTLDKSDPTTYSVELVGFSKNPANPFVQPAAGQSTRVGPFFEFKNDRLTDSEATPDELLEYRDALPGQTRPFLYLSTAGSGAYRTADAEGVQNGWLPYKKTATTFWNPNSYQLISAGSDADYGKGGVYDPNNTSSLDKDADNLTNFNDAALGG